MWKKKRMRKEICVDEDAFDYIVIDLDTGIELKDVTMADDGTGKYVQYKINSSGGYIWDNESEGFLKERKKGNIKVIRRKLLGMDK